MGETCGCGQPGNPVTIKRPGEDKIREVDSMAHSHTHNQEHFHTHEHHNYGEGHLHTHQHSHDGREVLVEQDILTKNNLLAERNRGFFEARGLIALNLVSSPGSGKTSLLEKTLSDLKNKHTFYVIEGDQQTMNDAERIHDTGTQVVQINTGEGCHLDSLMIRDAIQELNPMEKGFLMIENVGNLVCPALFDLGETKRVVVMSITEGEDKPIKYPTMFQSADLCIINKMDLLPYLDFNLEKAKEYAARVKPELKFIELSVKSGEGMKAWYEWLGALV